MSSEFQSLSSVGNHSQGSLQANTHRQLEIIRNFIRDGTYYMQILKLMYGVYNQGICTANITLAEA